MIKNDKALAQNRPIIHASMKASKKPFSID
jgi:hypothetical protein